MTFYKELNIYHSTQDNAYDISYKPPHINPKDFVIYIDEPFDINKML